MIEINLLPEELRNRVIKPLKQVKGANLKKFDPKLLVVLVPLIFLLLILAHIYLAFLLSVRSHKLNTLKAKWESSFPQRKTLEEFNAEHDRISSGTKEMEKFLSERINWGEKLFKLSTSLPEGVWLESLFVNKKEFYLKGKAVSLKKEEVSLIRNYVEGIKADSNFMKHFVSLELASIQKSSIGAYQVADFSLSGSLKQ
jgi:Tfp pilus assembly protein PilN